MTLSNINFEEYFCNPKFHQVKDAIENINSAKEYKIISDFTLTRKEVFDIFNTRFEIQKFVRKNDAVKGYEYLISNISEISDDTILKVIAIKTDNIFMQFFLNNKNEKLLGILWREYN